MNGLIWLLSLIPIACNLVQGILGVLLREPLLDWQREAAVLKGQGRASELQQQPIEETYIPLKVRCRSQFCQEYLKATLAPWTGLT